MRVITIIALLAAVVVHAAAFAPAPALHHRRAMYLANAEGDAEVEAVVSGKKLIVYSTRALE